LQLGLVLGSLKTYKFRLIIEPKLWSAGISPNQELEGVVVVSGAVANSLKERSKDAMSVERDV
jgi:hypothetical protein